MSLHLAAYTYTLPAEEMPGKTGFHQQTNALLGFYCTSALFYQVYIFFLPSVDIKKRFCAKLHKTSEYDVKNNYSLLFSAINLSKAAVIEGAFTVGASKSKRKPASFTALAVVGPKQPIAISPCLKSGKFFINE